ncbi:Uncharacterized protein YebE, UPF0316 family [Desulfonispora thiosulfatigenes DSM 11270]|uniref:Uncharacterized protein YebE, UPF0316 family n=1 Tax=Desulfonispora thiosulfatigenes DSM 11270 TaxID=656914 RepID=A0A1W1ULI3_DESTI|nr:DUF5698 domain-containing protein [Desulfonispora thiosulfatigenes]SMB81966.1 Uncharacterized protein YebE, UPF0316 family [Desulfonispora thiosulfatigenes DSM 11270]
MQEYLIIFLAMAVFVSLNTIRVILIIRGKKGIASILAAAENFIYMSTFAYAISGSGSNIVAIIIASGGYACGVLTGSIVEKKLNMGHLVVQIIADGELEDLIEGLRKSNYAITNWKVQGLKGNKEMLYLLVKKKRYYDLESKIKELKPNSFIVVTEPNYFNGGYGN